MKPTSKTTEDGCIIEKFQEEINDQNEEISTSFTIEKIFHEGERKDRWYHINIRAWAHMGSGLETQVELCNLAPSELKKLGTFLIECSKS